MGAMKKAEVALVCYIVCGSVAMANPTPRSYMDCPQYQYFDHGTEKCESCRDICDNAEYKRTEEQCWTKCKEYARLIRLQELPATPRPSTSTTQDGSPSTPWHIALAVSGLVICLVAILLMYLIRNKFSRRLKRRPTRVEIPEEISLNSLSAQPSDVEEGGNETTNLTASMSPSSGAAAGSPVQVSEEQIGSEKPGWSILPNSQSLPTEESSMPEETGAEQPQQAWEELPSYRILSGRPKSLMIGLERQEQGQGELLTYPPCPAPGGSGGQEVTSPVPVSLEGQGGSYAIAFPSGVSSVTPHMEPPNTTDLGDDTELKTPQSSIPGGAIGGEN